MDERGRRNKPRFYVRTFQDGSIRMVDLMRCDLDAKDIVTIKLDQVKKINDLTPGTERPLIGGR